MKIVAAILLALTVMAPTGAMALSEPAYQVSAKAKRGDIRVKIIDFSMRQKSWKTREEIFDGDAWIPLDSERGWTLHLDVQHEENPDALE